MDKATIAKVQGFGFDVWMHGPNEAASWLIFEDPATHRLGYLELGGALGGGWNLFTVHLPNQRSGTGFLMHEGLRDFGRAELESCFALAPHWADSEARASVRKYRDMEHFRSQGSFEAAYRKLEKVDA